MKMSQQTMAVCGACCMVHGVSVSIKPNSEEEGEEEEDPHVTY